MDTKERLARLNEVYKHRCLIAADVPNILEKKRHKRGAAPPVSAHRTHGIFLWTPMFKTGARATGLTVPCGGETPDREEFRVLMRQHLETLILPYPAEAQIDVEDYSDMWPVPDLDEIQLRFPVAEWPVQLTTCAEFDRTLEKIGWEYRNPPQRPLGEPCTLRAFLATVWADNLPV